MPNKPISTLLVNVYGHGPHRSYGEPRKYRKTADKDALRRGASDSQAPEIPSAHHAEGRAGELVMNNNPQVSTDVEFAIIRDTIDAQTVSASAIGTVLAIAIQHALQANGCKIVYAESPA